MKIIRAGIRGMLIIGMDFVVFDVAFWGISLSACPKMLRSGEFPFKCLVLLAI